MSKRVELLNRVDGCALPPFLVCNLVGRRTRQLASGRGAGLSSQLVNETLREFLEGKLKYELDGREGHWVPGSMPTTAADDEKHPSNGAVAECSGKRLRFAEKDSDSALAGLRRG